jgi:monoamine oxidase
MASIASSSVVYDVVVIGAGVAGMAAAQTLAGKNKSVVVVEGRGRIGGRIQPVDFHGSRVDLGAQFVHGASKGNPLVRLLKEAGAGASPCKIHKVDWDGGYFYAGSGAAREVPENKLDQCYKLAEKAVSIAHNKRGQIYNAKTREADLSLGEELKKAIAKMNKKHKKGFDVKLVTLCASSEIGDDYAVDFEELSLCYWDQDDEYNGGDGIVKQKGFEPLLSYLSNGLNILLDQVVTSIARVGSGGEDRHVRVSCNGGTSHFCGRQIICTLPLGVLNSGTVSFEPALPAPLVESISSLGYGNMEKVVMKFKQRFWPNDSDCFYNMSGNPFRIWLDVGYAYEQEDNATLMCLVCGSYAKSLMSTGSDKDILLLAMASLREIFGAGVVPKDEARTLAMVDSHMITRWCTDPFALGSYSHIRQGALPSDYSALARRYWDGALHFAGEATSRRFCATVHGAILSGERAAKSCLASNAGNTAKKSSGGKAKKVWGRKNNAEGSCLQS